LLLVAFWFFRPLGARFSLNNVELEDMGRHSLYINLGP